ncbi:hypothetical protein BDV96DRAFT_645439 [Lophiotrema nucula]|uniref:DUF7907 domain-containing protein n=1 Tax=Lophiotrema nucula TaxID=690887 RepID=A0A6A5ZB22_9PLEO|nr:hypothetical protein BDV96DRAFT_645439 [Lophiotrema nucula]
MKLALPTLALALAASTSAQDYNQSAPFNLVIVSENKTVDGDYLASCHSGAGIESLCLTNQPSTSKPDPTPASVYQFNTTDTGATPNATIGQSGYLTWELHGADFNVSSALAFYFSYSSNVVLPLFYPGIDYSTVVPVAFDSNNLMNIQDYVIDTVNPPTYGDEKAYYRWYACTTYYLGYTYVNLAWTLGEAAPQNPTCVKVDVKRVFV